MRKFVLIGVALLLVGCQDVKRTEIDIGPNAAAVEREKIAATERIVEKVQQTIFGVQQRTLDAVKEQEEKRRHLCWQVGGRNCSGGSSYYGSRIRGIYGY